MKFVNGSMSKSSLNGTDRGIPVVLGNPSTQRNSICMNYWLHIIYTYILLLTIKPLSMIFLGFLAFFFFLGDIHSDLSALGLDYAILIIIQWSLHHVWWLFNLAVPFLALTSGPNKSSSSSSSSDLESVFTANRFLQYERRNVRKS